MNGIVTTIFLLLSALTLVSGIMVVTVKNIIHAALWLIASFFGVAAIYLLPVLPVTIVTQRGLVSGLMSGSSKS